MASIERRDATTVRIGIRLREKEGRNWVRRTIKFPEAMPIADQDAEVTLQAAQMEQDVAAWRQGNIPFEQLSSTITFHAPSTATPAPALFSPIAPSTTSGLTIKELADQWFNDHVDVNLEPTTRSSYHNLLETRTLPALGHLRPDELTPLVLNRFFNRLKAAPRKNTKKGSKESGKPLSDRSIRHHYDVLNYMLGWCLRMKLITHNPMKDFPRPKAKRRPLNILSDDQAVALLRCLAKEESLSFRCGVLLALFCGMRLGEVGGLYLQDVNFQEGTVDIRRALKYASGHGNYLGNPKSDAGLRNITLPAAMLNLLRETKAWHEEVARLIGDRWRGDGRIYCNWDGSAMHHSTPSKQWTAFAKRHGFEGVRFHDLRHSHATALMANNIDAVNVAARLGHSDPATTQRIYGHAQRTRDRASAAVMDDFYSRATAQPDAAHQDPSASSTGHSTQPGAADQDLTTTPAGQDTQHSSTD